MDDDPEWTCRIGGGGVSRTYTYSKPMAAGATLTGPTMPSLDYASVASTFDTDQDGTFFMEFSQNGGVDWDRQKPVDIAQLISSGSPHMLGIINDHYRIVVVNGSVAQTHLRISARFHRYQAPLLVSSPNQRISRTNDVILVRGTNDPFLDLSAGLFADRSSYHIEGINSDVGTASFEDVWEPGGAYPHPVAGTTDTIRIRAGGNVADTAAGLGARTVIVPVLDTNFEEQSVTLTTAGASASAASAINVMRVQPGAYVDDCGTAKGTNVGEIIIEHTSSGDQLADIQADAGKSKQTHVCVPKDHTAYWVDGEAEVEAGKPAQLEMRARPAADTAAAPFKATQLRHEVLAAEGVVPFRLRAYESFEEKTDIWWEAKASSGGGATQITVQYDLVFVKDFVVTVPQ